MASSSYPPSRDRPGISGHRSYTDGGPSSNSTTAGKTAQSASYIGFDITPNESIPDDSKGRWYRAHTKVMHVSQRDLDRLVRKQSSGDDTVLEALYDPQMRGSKRRHITQVMQERDATFPAYKHELVYLKLDRQSQSKDSKKSKKQTQSMQIILELRIPPPPNTGLLTSAPSSVRGPVDTPHPSRQMAALSLNPENGLSNLPEALQRPRNLSYAPSSAMPLRRNATGEGLLPGPRPSLTRLPVFLCDSDDSLGYRSASPASTVSTDTARSVPRISSGVPRRSYLQAANVTGRAPEKGEIYSTSIAEEEEDNDNIGTPDQTNFQRAQAPQDSQSVSNSGLTAHTHFSAKHKRASTSSENQQDRMHTENPNSRPSYTSSSTQTDPVNNSSIPCDRCLRDNSRCVSSNQHYKVSVEDDVTSIDESCGDSETASQDPGKSDLADKDYEKPSWMQKMQPGKLADFHSP